VADLEVARIRVRGNLTERQVVLVGFERGLIFAVHAAGTDHRDGGLRQGQDDGRPGDGGVDRPLVRGLIRKHGLHDVDVLEVLHRSLLPVGMGMCAESSRYPGKMSIRSQGARKGDGSIY